MILETVQLPPLDHVHGLDSGEQFPRNPKRLESERQGGIAYIKHLRHSPRAIEYFKGCGLSGEFAKTFGLGYAPEGWRALASVFPDYNDALLVESGLVISGEPDDENAAGEANVTTVSATV